MSAKKMEVDSKTFAGRLYIFGLCKVIFFINMHEILAKVLSQQQQIKRRQQHKVQQIQKILYLEKLKFGHVW